MNSVARNISDRIHSIAHSFSTEEDVRVKCEKIFTDEFEKLHINYNARYEVKVESGRIDALFNLLCIEYKAPGLLRTKFPAFVDEKVKYLPALAKEKNTDPSQIAGVMIDGINIGFFRQTKDGNVVREGSFEISENSIEQLISRVQTTEKKALISKNILESFDSQSPITKQLIQALWNALVNSTNTRTKMFYREWRRLFGQISSDNSSAEIIKEARQYGIDINPEQTSLFIFAIHTAYALIIKNIALLILQSKRYGQYQLSMHIARGDPVQSLAESIEDDTGFKNLGIRNFLEGDYFCWYTKEWTSEIAGVFKTIILELAQYEPHTASLKPEAIQDLMKDLYEGLLSKKMRHNLGEYYTPDWLAEYTLQQSGYSPEMKILDPTCGSGTFLVTAIKRTIEQNRQMDPAKLLHHILTHIYGIDLNPLAIISARTNFIIAIEPLLEYADDIEIPVYLGDAIFSPYKSNRVYSYFLDTDNGRINLSLPEELFLTPGLMAETLSKIDFLVNQIANECISLEQGVTILRGYLLERNIPVEHLLNLLYTIHEFEENEWDGIWCNIIKNYFSSVGQADFDIIVGNPPWVRWSDLPVTYRSTIKDFCKSYGLFSSDKFYGGVESDISTMVLYSVADKWLRNGGTLAMLITRSVFKTESSEGFRMFQFPDTEVKLDVIKVEDFTKLRPFDNASNKPALIVLKKGDVSTSYPVPWIVWDKFTRIKSNDSLQSVMNNTQRTMLQAHPVKGPGSPWLTLNNSRLWECLSFTSESIKKEYRGRKGICTDLNGLFFGSISKTGLTKGTTVFTNQFGTRGKTAGLSSVSIRIETDLIYPIALGREIRPFKWCSTGVYGIIPQKNQKGFSEADMLAQYPKALSYFSNYKSLLIERSSYKRYNQGAPFYSSFNVGEYSFAPYKVCWREISGSLQSCVLTEKDGKVIVPDHKIYFVPLHNEEEAHYLCGMLNTSIINEIVLNYAENTQIGTHIFDYVNISKFDYFNDKHRAISNLSKQAHDGLISVDKAIEKLDEILSTYTLAK